MDQHILPGVKAKDVAKAHRQDVLIQNDHACNCITYWIDEKRGHVFCLIEAPNYEAVQVLHNKSHGLAPNKIIEVNPALVESFLGRISDPEEAEISEEGLKVFHDPSFRILLVLKKDDPVLLCNTFGKEKATAMLQQLNETISKELKQFGGKETEHAGDNSIASFTSAGKAIDCALSIRKKIQHINHFKTSIHAGEPVTNNEKLFGETIQFAERLCLVAKNFQVAVSSSVKELAAASHFQNTGDIVTFSQQDESLLVLLFNQLDMHWQDSDFNVADYCRSMAMSESQLYRKTIALTGLSPNKLLKEHRLEKAKELMKKKNYNISQITFDSGFTSPSYFTKCFKKKFGLLPMAYLDMLP
ncbi:MAG: nickel-binding protein [Bacteroidota bacterium]